jgi:hypothetical protein
VLILLCCVHGVHIIYLFPLLLWVFSSALREGRVPHLSLHIWLKDLCLCINVLRVVWGLRITLQHGGRGPGLSGGEGEVVPTVWRRRAYRMKTREWSFAHSVASRRRTDIRYSFIFCPFFYQHRCQNCSWGFATIVALYTFRIASSEIFSLPTLLFSLQQQQ